MAFDLKKARQFVYRHGTLLERALYSWLFDGGSLQRLHQIILCYKNPDNGFGHGLEHDIKAPQSNPLALEYLLGVMKHAGVPAGSVLTLGRPLGWKRRWMIMATCGIRQKLAIIRLNGGGRRRAGRRCLIRLSATSCDLAVPQSP